MSAQPRHTFGGDGEPLHLALANGFPPQTYRPLAAQLMARFHVFNLPPRALWPGEKPPQKRINWKRTLAADLIAALIDADLRGIVGVGHSFGGIATILAAIAQPERFKAVVLLDATILPAPAMWWMQLAQWLNRDLGNKLAQGADRRRDHFDSRQAAYERLRNKRLFADWHDDAFQGYIDAMRDTPEGEVTLAWPREWEAYYFRTLYAGTWRELPRLRDTGLPVLVVRGGTSDTLLSQAAQRIQRIMPDVTYREIDGHGHLFPHSAPHQTADLILSWLDTL